MRAHRALVLVAALAAALAASCMTHLDKNAPGNASLAETPRQIALEAVETPQDPGETILQVGLRPAAIVGGLWSAGTAQGTFRLSVQLLAGLQQRETSHTQAAQLGLLLAPTGHFVALGWDVLTLDDFDTGAARLGALHAQWLYRWPELASHLGAGYAYNPFTGAHGPVLSFNTLYLNYLRAGYLFGEGFHLGWGLTFEIPHGWAWSR